MRLLPFTIEDLAKLPCKDSRLLVRQGPSPSILLQQVSALASIIISIFCGLLCYNVSCLTKVPLHLLSYLWSYLLPFATKR